MLFVVRAPRVCSVRRHAPVVRRTRGARRLLWRPRRRGGTFGIEQKGRAVRIAHALAADADAVVVHTGVVVSRIV
eukprot:6787885-Pyramimonas_sp.AAC.1